ncbi:MAG: outer membrane beta-barrel protein [Alphaproteobacteria bacterium]
MSLTPTTKTILKPNQPDMWGDADQGEIADQGMGFNLGLGYNVSDSVSFELGLEKDAISTSYGLGMNVRLYNTNKFNFYTTLGIANTMYDDGIISNPKSNYFYNLKESTAMKFSLGLGVEYDITEKYSFYTSLERVEYSGIITDFGVGSTNMGELDLSVAPNNKISVGAKYKF